VPGRHSGEEIGPVDGIEGVRPVVGEHHCVGWVGAEGGVDDEANVLGPALDVDPELQRASDRPASGSNLMQTMAAKRSHASQVAMGLMPSLLGFWKATPLLVKSRDGQSCKIVKT
jgi:hypothetical protein